MGIEEKSARSRWAKHFGVQLKGRPVGKAEAERERRRGLHHAGQEFEGAELGDRRRTARLVETAEQLARHPDRSFPGFSRKEAMVKGAYRLMEQKRNEVNYQAMLAPHFRATRERLGEVAPENRLLLNDTMEAGFPGSTRKDLPVSPKAGTQSLFWHFTLAVEFDPENPIPLGLLRAESFTSTPRSSPKKASAPKEVLSKAKKVLAQAAQQRLKNLLRKRARLAKARAQRESSRWGRGLRAAEGSGLQCIHVADREVDDYANLVTMTELKDGFVFRSNHNRCLEGEKALPRDATHPKISDFLLTLKPLAQQQVLVSRRVPSPLPSRRKRNPKRSERVVEVELFAGTLTVRRPRHDVDSAWPETVTLNVVEVREKKPVPGEPRLHWKLLTNLPIDSVAAVQRIVQIYRTRWLIEEFHKALKTGCAYEQRQLESREALERCLALLAPLAWHLLLVRTLCRVHEHVPASLLFSPSFLEVLSRVSRIPLPARPSASQALLCVASVGGHLKHNGPPGWLVLLRGYQQLLLLEEGFLLASTTRKNVGNP